MPDGDGDGETHSPLEVVLLASLHQQRAEAGHEGVQERVERVVAGAGQRDVQGHARKQRVATPASRPDAQRAGVHLLVRHGVSQTVRDEEGVGWRAMHATRERPDQYGRIGGLLRAESRQ